MRPPTATAVTNDRSWLLLIGSWVAVFVGTVILLAGPGAAVLPHAFIVEGGVALLWLLSAAGIGAAVVRIPSESKCLAFATAAAMGLGIMSLVTLGLALAGALNQVVAIAVVLAGLIAGAVRLIPSLKSTRIELPAVAPRHWIWLMLAPLAGVAIVAVFVPPGFLWGDEPHAYDVLEYHLQVPREWFELGRAGPLTHNVFSFFPFNVEMHYLLAMHLRGGPWAGMYLAQLMHLTMVTLTVVAIAGVTRPWVAILVAGVPWMTLLGTIAYNEGGLLLFGTLAILWMMRSDGKLGPCVLAGAFAGFACGTKLTAVPILLVGIPLAGFAMRLKRKHALAFGLAGLITLSPWLIRNVAWTGNPVFPMASSIFGSAHFTPDQVERFKLAHGPAEAQRGFAPKFVALWKQVLADWRYGWLIVPLAIVAAMLRRDRQTLFLIGLAGLMLVFWLAATHQQGRFFVLGIPIAAILISRSPRQQVLSSVCLGGAVLGMGLTGARLREIDASIASRTGGVGLFAVLAGDGIDRMSNPILSALRSDSTLILVGDAQPFLYHLPMSRLRYRTVFDVDVEGDDVIGSWISDSAGPGDAVLVDPNELRRFSRTYFGIPPYTGSETEPFLLAR